MVLQVSNQYPWQEVVVSKGQWQRSSWAVPSQHDQTSSIKFNVWRNSSSSLLLLLFPRFSSGTANAFSEKVRAGKQQKISLCWQQSVENHTAWQFHASHLQPLSYRLFLAARSATWTSWLFDPSKPPCFATGIKSVVGFGLSALTFQGLPRLLSVKPHKLKIVQPELKKQSFGWRFQTVLTGVEMHGQEPLWTLHFITDIPKAKCPSPLRTTVITQNSWQSYIY